MKTYTADDNRSIIADIAAGKPQDRRSQTEKDAQAARDAYAVECERADNEGAEAPAFATCRVTGLRYGAIARCSNRVKPGSDVCWHHSTHPDAPPL